MNNTRVHSFYLFQFKRVHTDKLVHPASISCLLLVIVSHWPWLILWGFSPIITHVWRHHCSIHSFSIASMSTFSMREIFHCINIRVRRIVWARTSSSADHFLISSRLSVSHVLDVILIFCNSSRRVNHDFVSTTDSSLSRISPIPAASLDTNIDIIDKI